MSNDDPFDLEPIEPRIAKKLYLQDKAANHAESTVQAHHYRLKHLMDWCDKEWIDNLNDISGRDIQQYRLWRQSDGAVNQVTMQTQMTTVRVFHNWAASIETVKPDLPDRILIPKLERGADQRDQILEPDVAQDILNYLGQFHYASIEHALMATLWQTGMRIGGAHSLDLQDVHLNDEYIEVVHRPSEGTTLKNGEEGERYVALSPNLVDVLKDYTKSTREEREDEFGREPLFTTTHGRAHRTTLRDTVYKITAPCYRNADCQGCNPERGNKCDEGCESAYDKAGLDYSSPLGRHSSRNRGRSDGRLTEGAP